MTGKTSELLSHLVFELRKKHYARSTEQAYLLWVRQYVQFSGKRHLKELGANDIEAFLSHLAVKKQLAASTQNQALNALVFLYRHVIKTDVGDFSAFTRAKISSRIPEVFSPQEIADIFAQLAGIHFLIARVIYGGGLRVRECLTLRTKDIDFENCRLIVARTNAIPW